MKLSPLDKNFFVLFTLYLIKIRNYWPEWRGNGFIFQVKNRNHIIIRFDSKVVHFLNLVYCWVNIKNNYVLQKLWLIHFTLIKMSWNFSKSGKDIQIFQNNVYLKFFNNTSLVKDHKQEMLFLLFLPLTYPVSK